MLNWKHCFQNRRLNLTFSLKKNVHCLGTTITLLLAHTLPQPNNFSHHRSQRFITFTLSSNFKAFLYLRMLMILTWCTRYKIFLVGEFLLWLGHLILPVHVSVNWLRYWKSLFSVMLNILNISGFFLIWCVIYKGFRRLFIVWLRQFLIMIENKKLNSNVWLPTTKPKQTQTL